MQLVELCLMKNSLILSWYFSWIIRINYCIAKYFITYASCYQ